MKAWLIPLISGFLVLFLLYVPEIFPKCGCCQKKKFRMFFRIHRAVSVRPGYSGNRSVCRRCCREYGITDINDLDKIRDIKRRLKIDSLLKNPLE